MLVAALAALAALAGAQSLPVGQWNDYIDLLPALQLPAVPILGNGHLGIAMDSKRTTVGSVVGPGSANTLDLWLTTTSMWSCTDCGGVDPDKDVPACCSVVALGAFPRHTRSPPSSPPQPPF